MSGGAVFCLAPCIGCGGLFCFHPDRVPSLLVDGVREPICEDCVRAVNPIRKANGLEEIVPLPGAYEPAEDFS